jgi:hypothetical protein
MGVLTALFLGAATYLTYQQMKGGKLHGSEPNPDYNPFFYGNPVSPDQSFTIMARGKIVRDLVEQIQTGQSGAIIGAFSHERTLILKYIEERKEQLFGNQRFIFSFLDISALRKTTNQTQFWEYALEPLQAKFASETDSVIFKAYESCRENDFNNRYLDKLIVQMKQEGFRLVLMLDQFEVLLERPQLKNEEFLGGLRVLASSHHPSPLCVVIANKPVWQFHEDIKALGSPYLNFLEAGAVTLGAISDAEIDKLLDKSGYPFTDNDKYFLKEVSGNHPYLLQVATVILISAYRDKEENPIENTRIVFFDQAEEMLMNIFKFWSPRLCEAFILVAQQKLDVSNFRREIKELNRQGFIKQENEQWQVSSSVFADLAKNKTVQEACKQTHTIT